MGKGKDVRSGWRSDSAGLERGQSGRGALRVILSSFSSPKGMNLRRMLCEKHVPIARIEPSPVDMDAATIAMSIHAPRKAGIGWKVSEPASKPAEPSKSMK